MKWSVKVLVLAGSATLFISFWAWQKWDVKRHYVGKGAEGPTQALIAFADAIDRRDYSRLRELLDYQAGVCGGMDLVAVDVNDPDALERSYQDHLSLIAPLPIAHGEGATDAYVDLLNQSILPYRWYMLHYTDYLGSLNLDQYASRSKIKINIPRLYYLERPNDLILDPSHGFNELTLITRQGRWYIYNFSCQAMGVVSPDESQLEYAETPRVNGDLLQEMCALGTVTPLL
jgi:hypothetical protein